MGAVAKLSITLTLRSLLLLLLYFSPTNQTHHLLSFPPSSTSTILQNQPHSHLPNIKKNDVALKIIEQQLVNARINIRKAIVEKRVASNEIFVPNGSIYMNPFSFFQSHAEMMNTFKIWTYKEGDIPLMHTGPMRGVYSIEGDFIEEMERKGNPMVANHPDEAHAFFIPISITNIVRYLYTPAEPYGYNQRIQAIVEDYIGVIAERYPYWNRSNGADHFFVSCHDWAPFASRGNPKLFENVIRVLCNANISEGFIPQRDVSMSEINGPLDNIPIVSRGQSPYNRSILAFFAGRKNGDVRKTLFQHWGNKEDDDIQVHTYLPEGQNYTELLSQSKYCLCPSGFEVASARVTEAIHVGCIPVTIKNHYVLPYSDVLEWSEFSIQVSLDKIPDLKRILEEISFSRYLEMQKRVMEVQKHFMVNIPAKEFDVFHMILHSVWLRRLDVQLQTS